MAKMVEDFEGVTAGPNSPLDFGTGYFRVAFQGFYDFGFTSLVEPIGGDAVVGDFSVGDASFGASLTAGDVPGGFAFIASDTPAGWLRFVFDDGVHTVGAHVDTKSGESPGLVAFDSKGNLITGAQVRMVPFGSWGDNYIEVTSKEEIAFVKFMGGYVMVDDLTIDTAKPKVVKGTGGDDKLNRHADGKQATSDKSEHVLGKGGNDKISAEGGNDTIDGGPGKNKIHGGDGNDSIRVGSGKSTVFGDAGQDTVVVTKLGSPTKFKDFNVQEDAIVLSVTSFPGLPDGKVPIDQFTIGSGPEGTKAQIIYNQANGWVSFDPDGTGPAAPTHFLTLPKNLILYSDNFLVA